ncbi:MAG TPA: hypothetical protein VFX97_01430 [Pyrinomonadaceae bacterium]|nr:hypothetical protein [Pyrinomonadaceae bacterium]
MGNLKRIVLLVLALAMAGGVVHAQRAEQSQFGPVMQAYLGYLRNEQEVVDDRASRHEISGDYYRRNSNRIRALRQMAIRLVTKSDNDYVPELEAVAADEMRILFEEPPSPRTLRVSQIVKNTFRYLGPVTSGEVFYVFARLDPYEQAALIESGNGVDGPMSSTTPDSSAAKGQRVGDSATRPRRSSPR